MTRPALRAAALAAALALALPARAQLARQDRAQGLPAGLDLPVLGGAAAEEPATLPINPAGVGFVGGPALQYLHEGGPSAVGSGDGLYLADRFGPLALGLSQEWLRPGDGPLPRYRRTQLTLALTDGRAVSLGGALAWVRASGSALDRAGGWSLGLTLRPLRALSLSAAALGNGAELAGRRLPVRFDLGLATRHWDDRLTLSADLLADDRGQRFRTDRARLGAAVELPGGLAPGLALDLPLRGEGGPGRGAGALLTLAFNGAHAGAVVGGSRAGGESGWLAGLRLSGERYRSDGIGRALATVELPRDLQPDRLLWFTVGDRDPYGRLVERLLAARDDPSVGALLLRVDSAPLGAGRVEELRRLLAAVRERKPVVAYLTGGGTREYWLATGATAVAAPPGAPLLFNGLGGSQLYYRDLLARLGVAVQVVRAGAYKSATEPLVRTGPSPEAAEMAGAVLDDTFARLVADVAEARRLPPERVRALVDQGLFTSDEARAEGLVDATPWPDEVGAWARQVAGRALYPAGRYRPDPPRAAQRWGRPPVVEVIRLAGLIAGGRSSPDDLLGDDGLAGAGAVAAALHRAADDPDVRAVVLRIESPGGDGLASDLVWREVTRTREKGKPVVASLGDVAASGGYLVAAGADAIVAEPSTLTGSIGVFAAKPDLGGLLERLSIHREGFTRGAKADALSLLRPWTEPEQQVIQRQVDAFYALFLDRVATGRKLARAEVEAVAAGRVWTGRQALERRLVDRLGGLPEAVALAREAAGLPPGDGVVVRRAGAGGGGGLSLAILQGGAQAGPLERLWRASPELQALWVAADGRLGPLLALPEEWLGAAP